MAPLPAAVALPRRGSGSAAELLAAADAPPRTLLELGAGAGNLARHLNGSLEIALTDRSPHMLEISKRVNPECVHLLGHIRTLDPFSSREGS